jgi:hypothetical protein
MIIKIRNKYNTTNEAGMKIISEKQKTITILNTSFETLDGIKNLGGIR